MCFNRTSSCQPQAIHYRDPLFPVCSLLGLPTVPCCKTESCERKTTTLDWSHCKNRLVVSTIHWLPQLQGSGYVSLSKQICSFDYTVVVYRQVKTRWSHYAVKIIQRGSWPMWVVVQIIQRGSWPMWVVVQIIQRGSWPMWVVVQIIQRGSWPMCSTSYHRVGGLICRDSTDTQYMLIQTNFSKSPKQLTYKPL